MSETGSILIAEDYTPDFMLLQRALEQVQLDYTIQRVLDGEQVIAYLSGDGVYADRAQHPFPRLLMLDLHLPRRSGTEVLAWMRERNLLAQVPVVVITGSENPYDAEEVANSEAKGLLVKPVSVAALRKCLQQIDHELAALNRPPLLRRA
jgi:CheY-like chemotaxis protein